MTDLNTNHEVNLANLSEAELRDVMYARLVGNPSVGPPVDSRIGQEALEWLSDQFRRGDAGLQHRMTAVLEDFLQELPDTNRWPERARYALLDLIQDCGESLIDDLHRLIRQQTFLNAEGLGAEVHAALLKCLISNGHHATPDFWIKQFDVLGPPYGALIFSGLVDHGLELAMSHLPALSGDEEAKTYIRWLFPHSQDKFGAAAVLELLEQVRNRLPVETYQLYRRDLVVPTESDVTTSCADQSPNSRDQRVIILDPPPIQSMEVKSDPKPPPGLVELVRQAKAIRPESPRPFPGLFPVATNPVGVFEAA